MSDGLLKLSIPEKLGVFLEPMRYKIAYGGRGGGKSVGIASILLAQGMQKPLLIVCAREFQNSISDSVHRQLADLIVELGMESFYEVQATTIKGRNGTEFIFKGLRHNISGIKSLANVDRCWCEEAQTISRSSWEVLIPTIRKEGSEIWVSLNPELEDDETYKRFIKSPPPNSAVVSIGWQDNPWFPSTLEAERSYLKTQNPDAYLHVWEGYCRLSLEGAVYSKELRDATEQGRICKVPYQPNIPVSTYWDLGWSDSTAIWFVQRVGFEHRVIRYQEFTQTRLSEILLALQSYGYVYGEDWLPHDAQAKTLAAGGQTIEQQMRTAGRKVRIVPRASLVDGINAVRELFPLLWIDEMLCSDGLQCLRHYQYEVDPGTGQFSRKPLHNFASHGADAARSIAMAYREPKKTRKVEPARQHAVWTG